MFRAMAVDSSVLLLSCSITTGALGIPGMLPTLHDNNIISHNHHTHNHPSFCLSTSLHLYTYNSTMIRYNTIQVPHKQQRKPGRGYFERLSPVDKLLREERARRDYQPTCKPSFEKNED